MTILYSPRDVVLSHLQYNLQGILLHCFRKAHRISIDDLSAKTYTHNDTWRKFETGEEIPSERTLAHLHNQYEIYAKMIRPDKINFWIDSIQAVLNRYPEHYIYIAAKIIYDDRVSDYVLLKAQYISAILKWRLHKSNITPRQYAIYLGVPDSTAFKIINGEKQLSSSLLKRTDAFLKYYCQKTEVLRLNPKAIDLKNVSAILRGYDNTVILGVGLSLFRAIPYSTNRSPLEYVNNLPKVKTM